jgi:hypothetical protein
MSSSICIPSSSTSDASAVQAAADISEPPQRDRQRRLNRSEEVLFRRKEPERAREMFCKRPSELRSRRTPKGTIIRLSDLDQQDSDRMLEEDSSSRMPKEENAARFDEEMAGGTVQNTTLDSSPKVIEVPLLSLVVNKRKGKSKGGCAQRLCHTHVLKNAFDSSYGRLRRYS